MFVLVWIVLSLSESKPDKILFISYTCNWTCFSHYEFSKWMCVDWLFFWTVLFYSIYCLRGISCVCSMTWTGFLSGAQLTDFIYLNLSKCTVMTIINRKVQPISFDSAVLGRISKAKDLDMLFDKSFCSSI